MLKFHSLRVLAVERLAEDAACVTLQIPVDLRAAFAHDAGQYVTLRRKIEEKDEHRTYSIVSAPGSSEMKLGIRLQHGGRMSGDLAANLRPGEMLDLGTPMGRFRTSINAERRYGYVAFAAGSGITPILSLATEIMSKEPLSRFTLIYGNRSIARTMFLEDTLALKNRYLDRFSVHFLMSREPQQAAFLNGRIDGAKVRELSSQIVEICAADEYLICGPGDMVDEVRGVLQSLNGSAQIRFERFASAIRPRKAAEPLHAIQALEQAMASISIVMDGRRRTFPMSPGDASVLDAAERAGLELPFSCRAGICATCRARVIDGAAVMTHNIALAKWEIDGGFILCCQARPVTATLEVSYDQK